MLSVAGIVYISKKPVEKTSDYGTYFKFEGITKDPYGKHNKNYYIEVLVPQKHLEKARSQIDYGKVIQIRMGELNSIKNIEANLFINIVSTRWNWIEPLKKVPSLERQE